MRLVFLESLHLQSFLLTNGLQGFMLDKSAFKLACEVSGVAFLSVLAQNFAFIVKGVTPFLQLNHLEVSW
jgi:hypothetical protein